jgi:hypothetical protein
MTTIFIRYNSITPAPPTGQQNITFNAFSNLVSASDPIFVGDTGTGGLAGNVPAPAIGDAIHFLRGDRTWALPTPQVQVDWNATSGLASILHKPTLATVATSGSYTDLSNKPTLISTFTNDAGYITAAGAPVQSVAGRTGAVTLAASDIYGLAAVATSGSYLDLNHTPVIPTAQVNSDWNAVSGVTEILNKPTLGGAAALNVGTTAGTVAAGDDSRIVNAASRSLAIAYAIAL